MIKLVALLLGIAFSSIAYSAEKLTDCKMTAPASAAECKPGEAPAGAIEFDRHRASGTVDAPIQSCERQRIWVEGDACNYCRIKDQPCAT